MVYLWRAVDQEGEVLESYVTKSRDKQAALTFMKKALWFRDALKQKGCKPCIPGRTSRSFPVQYDKRRNRIELMFDRLKDLRRVATRYDRCSTDFFSALALAATVLVWL